MGLVSHHGLHQQRRSVHADRLCETRISSGLAAILNATTPIFTILVAHVVTVDEKLTRAKAAGVALGFLGVAVLIGPAALSSAAGGDVVTELACLRAALAYKGPVRELLTGLAIVLIVALNRRRPKRGQLSPLDHRGVFSPSSSGSLEQSNLSTAGAHR